MILSNNSSFSIWVITFSGKTSIANNSACLSFYKYVCTYLDFLSYILVNIGRILEVIDGRFSVIENDFGGLMTVNNNHLVPFVPHRRKRRWTLRKKKVPDDCDNDGTTTTPAAVAAPTTTTIPVKRKRRTAMEMEKFRKTLKMKKIGTSTTKSTTK